MSAKSFKEGKNKKCLLIESMKTIRLIGIVLFSIGLAIIISGGIISNANPDYNYSSYTGFRFPEWLYFFASMLGLVGSMLIFHRGKTKQTPFSEKR